MREIVAFLRSFKDIWCARHGAAAEGITLWSPNAVGPGFGVGLTRRQGLTGRWGTWLVLCSFAACRFSSTAAPGVGGGDNDGGNPADGSAADFSPAPPDLVLREIGNAPGCGNGRVDPELNEACDDGNSNSGDGCSADCKTIEPDFDCSMAGRPCIYLVKCGDGVLGGTERCDPPNPGNGCTAACQLEPGFVCQPPAPPTPTPTPAPAVCHRTLCGDGTREGSEACDDGNTVDGDGCGGNCTLEPDCATGRCLSRCGDSAKLPPEACDDGNTKDGDGCSRDCTVESGFSCSDTTLAPPMQLNLRVTYRDFISFPTTGATRHPDFESFSGSGVTPLLVKTTLDTAGKPILDGRCTTAGVTVDCPYDRQVTSAATFADWYQDTPGKNVGIVSALLLPRLGNGSYVFDSGTHGFYPIDDKGWMAPPAKEVAAMADPVINDGGQHNFGFTTEIRYFFQYRGGESLTFSGDDDVWIFVNRRLALDLGGMHTMLQKVLNVDQSAGALGLVVGQLYEIVLFHAERHSTGSNFKLTLTGFGPTSSTCHSSCGDGILASTEQCDDGNTVNGDGCSSDCRHETVIP